MTADDKISKLEAEIEKQKSELAALKAASKPPPMPTKEEMAAEADRMHQMRERAANAHTFLTPEQIRAMDAACSPADAHDLASHGVVQSPSMAGTSGRVAGVHPHGGPAGGGTGWAREIPLGPPPGVAQSDRLMDAADKADRIELAQRLAAQELARRAMKK